VPIILELTGGGHLAIGWALWEGQPTVRVATDAIVMLTSPDHAGGWMADFLHQEGREDLANAFRHAAQEAMNLIACRRRHEAVQAAPVAQASAAPAARAPVEIECRQYTIRIPDGTSEDHVAAILRQLGTGAPGTQIGHSL
jgi:hypothetical protein